MPASARHRAASAPRISTRHARALLLGVFLLSPGGRQRMGLLGAHADYKTNHASVPTGTDDSWSYWYGLHYEMTEGEEKNTDTLKPYYDICEGRGACGTLACIKHRTYWGHKQCPQNPDRFTAAFTGQDDACYGCLACPDAANADHKVPQERYTRVAGDHDYGETNGEENPMIYKDTYCFYQCQTGYYADGSSCSACSGACGSAYYQSSACNTGLVGWFGARTATESVLTDLFVEKGFTGGADRVCELCPPGHQQGNTQTSCALCEADKFRLADSTAGCVDKTDCDETSQESEQSNADADRTCRCKAGYYRGAGASGLTAGDSQQLCSGADVGHYVSQSGQTTQTMCAAGTYTAQTASTSCTSADVGHYAEQGSSEQTRCPAGQYQDLPGQSACTPCAGDAFAAAAAAVRCLPHALCAGPSTVNYNVPSASEDRTCQCAAGHWRAGDGTGLPGSAEATFAAATEHVEAFDYVLTPLLCNAAAAGSFVAAAGSVQPTACPPGQFQESAGQTACEACAVGSYAPDPGHVRCSSCEPGKFQHLGGQPDCLFCREDNSAQYPEVEFVPNGATYFTGEARCYACPPNSVAETVSAHPADHQYSDKQGEFVGHTYCECAAGYVADPATLDASQWATAFAGEGERVVNGLRCVACAQGAYKEHVSNATECVRCPAALATTVEEASVALSACLCLPNSWGDDRCCSTCAPGAAPAPGSHAGNAHSEFADVCAACAAPAGAVLRDAACEAVSCAPGLRLVDGACELCDELRFCRDGQARQCVVPSGAAALELRAPMRRGASRAEHCRCGLQMKTNPATGECEFCRQIQPDPDWDQNFRYALTPATGVVPQAVFGLDCLVRCADGFTGQWCLEACAAAPVCARTERLEPCAQPWSAYCRPCPHYVPAAAQRADGTYEWRNPPLLRAGFERGDTLQHPLLDVPGEAVSSSRPGTASILDRNCAEGASDCVLEAEAEARAGDGARGSQGWLRLGADERVASRVELGAHAVARFYASLVDGGQTAVRVEAGPGGAHVVAASRAWEQHFVEFHGAELSAVDEPLFVDELEVHAGLVPPVPGGEEVRGAAACAGQHACRGAPGFAAAQACPSGEGGGRAVFGSNVCVCAPGFRFFPDGGACRRCPPAEACERGYSAGRLVAWRNRALLPSSAPWVAMPQLACGPRVCCALRWAAGGARGEPVCWGDNSHGQLGAAALEENSQTRFFRDARPVANLAAPVVAVAVSQAWGTAVAGAEWRGGWGPSDGSSMSCALLEDGAVQCWGGWFEGDTFHTCLAPDFLVTGDAALVPGCGFHPGSTQRTAVQVKTGQASACARLDDGTLRCWGRRSWDEALVSGAVADFALTDVDLCVVQGGQVKCVLGNANSLTTVDSSVTDCALVALANNTLCAFCGNALRCRAPLLQGGALSASVQATPINVNPIAAIHVGMGFACVHEGYDAASVPSPRAWCIRTPDWAEHPRARLAQEVFTSTASWTRVFSTLRDVVALSVAGGLVCATTREGDLHDQYASASCVGDGASALMGQESCADDPGAPVAFGGLRLHDPTATPGWMPFGDASFAAERGGATLPERAAVAHELGVAGEVWAQVRARLTCSGGPCRVALAKNLIADSVMLEGDAASDTFLEDVELANLAEHVFALDTLADGETAVRGGHVFARPGDSLAVVLLPSAGGASSLAVHSVFAVEDGDACPFSCPDGTVLRNGECLSCAGSCDPGFWEAGCAPGRLSVDLDCRECGTGGLDAKPADSTTTYLDAAQLQAEGLDPDTPCYWRCPDEHYWRSDQSECAQVRTAPCPVGQFLYPATRESDATCQPCSSEGVEPGRVFIGHGPGGADSCPTECSAGRFLALFGCATCETRACGIGGARFTNAYMTEEPCTPAAQSKCMACPLDHPHATITASGGERCAYSCDAGFAPVAQCGVWDEFDTHGGQLALGELAGALAVGAEESDVVLRFTAEARVAAQTTGSRIDVRALVTSSAAAGAALAATQLFPRVDADTLDNVWQRVDARWHLPAVAAGAALQVTVAGEAFESAVEFRGAELRAQLLPRCDADAYACAACDVDAKPANAAFVVSLDCASECAADYERQADGSCRWCPKPACGVGEFQDGCDGCAPCEAAEANVEFTTAGLRDEPGSCGVSCAAGFFSQVPAGGAGALDCQACTVPVCAAGDFLRECGPTADAACAACTVCAPGTVAVGQCGGSTDTVCEPCVLDGPAGGVLPAHAEWVPAEASMLDGGLRLPEACAWRCASDAFVLNDLNWTCHPCAQACGVGEYLVDCSRATAYEGCQPCTVPANATATSRGRARPDSCAWECVDGFELAPLRNLVGLVTEFTCRPLETPPPGTTPAPPCALSADACAPGEALSASCACELCAAALPTHAVYVARGGCEWTCAPPFVKLGGACEGLRRLAPQSAAAPGAAPRSRAMRGEHLVLLACAVPFLAAVATFAVLVHRSSVPGGRAGRAVPVPRSKVLGV